MTPVIIKVWIDDTRIYISTKDGEIRSLPISDFKLLRNATKEELNSFEYDKYGIRWESLDEDISFEGFFTERPKPSPFCENIKNITGLNISALARKTGISQSTMAQYLCGAKNPSPKREKEIKEAILRFADELISTFRPTKSKPYMVPETSPIKNLTDPDGASSYLKSSQKPSLIEAIEKEMSSRYLTQSETATILGISESSLSLILSGRRQVSMKVAKKLYSELKIDPEIILG